MPDISILIVDDDLTNRLVLKSLLVDAGYLTQEVEDGQQAVDIVEKNNFDIILMDVMMPVMDGYDAAKTIKNQKGKFTPIIFLTAMTDEQSLTKCIDAGGDDFLTKPYNHAILKSKINAMLRIADLYKEIENKNTQLNIHNARIQQEVNVAKKVFDNVLSHDLKGSKTGLRYSMSPMSAFNGDMILAERNQTNGLDVLLSDFTGHGLSAAIGSIPVADIFYAMIKKGFSYLETISEANNKLLKLLPTQMFMSAVYININRTENILTLFNCGLPDVYLCRDGEIIKTFHSMNLPLGITSLQPDDFDFEMIPIEFGDRLIAATDGVMEAVNKQGEMFGLDRVLASINGATKPEFVFDKLLHDCNEFSQGVEQTDDVTLLEFCHKESVEYSDSKEILMEVKPAEWTIKLGLDIDSLRHFDILPYLMQGIYGLQSIPNGRATVHTIVTELFSNALDHGVLQLDSALKQTSEGYMRYYAEKSARLESYQEGSIQIELVHEFIDNGGRLTIHVIDSGNGFDYAQETTHLENNLMISGRGRALLNKLCKSVVYHGKGNAVTAIYEWESAVLT